MKTSSITYKIYKGLLAAVIFTNLQMQANAQKSKNAENPWSFGAAIATNVIFYDGYTHELNQYLIPEVTFDKGSGVGLYLASYVEYRIQGSSLKLSLQAGYDSRKGSFKEKKESCGCDDDLSTDLSYVSVEPGVIVSPFKPRFYLYLGPRLAFNVNKSFTFTQSIVSESFYQQINFTKKDDFSKMKKTVFSMQIGAGYDIPLSSRFNRSLYIISPFISFQPSIGQNPRNIETWKISTVRIGVVLKNFRVHKTSAPRYMKPNIPMF